MTDVYRIGLVMKSLQADFFRAMQKGAEAFAKQHQEVELICVGTQSQTEIQEQISLVHNLIEQKVDAIILVPIDSKALVEPAIEAVRAGIAVVNIDIQLDEMLLHKAGVSIPFLGPDNHQAAYEVAKCLCCQLQPGDEVAIIEGLPNAENAKQRKSGFMKAIKEHHLNLVASIPANWETAEAMSVYQFIQKQHHFLKALFCSNDAMALGVLEVMKQTNQSLPVVGFDNDLSVRSYLQSGRLIATVDIFSSQMAVFGIEYAINLIKKEAQTNGIHQTPFKLIS